MLSFRRARRFMASFVVARVVPRVVVCCVVVVFFAAGPAHAQAVAPTPVDAGRALYARYCQLCHAKDATGYAADNAPSLVSPRFLETANDAYIARGIRFGRPGTAMAAYGKARGGALDDAQIAEIVRFLRAKGPAAKPLPDFAARGSASRGAALYTQKCKSCHGTAKDPGKAPQLANSEFLAAASPAFLQHAILHGRPPTKMPAFEKRLDEGQVADVVAWLVSLRTTAPSSKPINPAVPDNLPLLINPKGAAPEFSLEGERFVSAEQVKRALDEKRRLIIIDARSPSDWIQFHIPGAVPIPYYDTGKLDRVPNDGTWVVAYCACPHHASGEVVDALRRRGFPKTAVLDEGILVWRRMGFAIEGAAAEPAGSPPAGSQPAAPK